MPTARRSMLDDNQPRSLRASQPFQIVEFTCGLCIISHIVENRPITFIACAYDRSAVGGAMFLTVSPSPHIPVRGRHGQTQLPGVFCATTAVTQAGKWRWRRAANKTSAHNHPIRHINFICSIANRAVISARMRPRANKAQMATRLRCFNRIENSCMNRVTVFFSWFTRGHARNRRQNYPDEQSC